MDSFFNDIAVFMLCVVKSNEFTIIFINVGDNNNGMSKVSADVFNGYIRSAKVRLRTDIGTFEMIFVDVFFVL